MPFFAVATTAPLLQKWFSITSEKSAEDPYFLYASSNAGSLLALAVHPFVLEPSLGVTLQSRSWFFGYILLTVMIGLTALAVWMRSDADFRKESESVACANVPAMRLRIYWVAGAFLPSALMLAVTNHIATNLASAPFVWVMPLAAYLLTFILAFAPRRHVSAERISSWIPIVLIMILATATILASYTFSGSVWLSMATHVALLFGCALLCHVAIAERRPSSAHLTEYYFWIALGGVVGGAFTALAAPALFRTVFEYPLLLAMVCFFRRVPRAAKRPESRWAVPAVIGVTALFGFVLLRQLGSARATSVLLLAVIMLVIAIYQLRDRSNAFAFAWAVLILVAGFVVAEYRGGRERLEIARNFFGVKEVLYDAQLQQRQLIHGDTMHGWENTAAQRLGEPGSYYHRSGPVGDVMAMLAAKGAQRLGVIGLGAGSMAAYASPNRPMTFFEIDPEMENIARRYFTFLDRCGGNCRVIIGDGRLEMERIPPGYFNYLMLDAFSSDAIPTHLLSREALLLYLSKLAPDGIIMFHVSNRYLDVSRLVSALIDDGSLVGFVRRDINSVLDGSKSQSIHIVAARRKEDLGALPSMAGWTRISSPESFRVWTDDYSNLLSIVKLW
jgi:spermidine synthase